MNKHIVGSVDLFIGIFKSKEIIHLSSIWMENKRVLSVLFQNILFSWKNFYALFWNKFSHFIFFWNLS